MKNIINNGNTKLILLHPYIHKQTHPNRLWLIALVSVFTIASLVTLVYTRESFHTTTTTTTTITATSNHHHESLPKSVIKALIHYAATANTTNHMSQTDIKQISDVLKQCTTPCNLLVFGLTPETLLWNALNHHGRTVFIDENRYYAAYVEEKFPEIEAYDVQYTTKISELKELIASVREQTLDGPRGYWPEGPGSISAIFTAGVLARSKKGGNHKTHVFVHDYNREVERVSSEEFLCKENLVKSSNDLLAHFVVERVVDQGGRNQFCHSHPAAS
ncbi:unnamed protein product [Lactuca saligna]|uniref:Polysaccharide biosynthesis domain-containing protein n=1 Tax=Lactuca saligna TaxID=75948 RepID=A0AA35YZ68_LACSI|nr:unnamed protein product [Lactuca saligna]